MAPRSSKTTACSVEDARARLRVALAYLEVSDLILDEKQHTEFLTVATGLAVLAGIAASDCICGIRLGQIHRGQSHQGAADLLATAVPDGAKLASTLRRLLDLKDASHYGVKFISGRSASDAVRWARTLVERAEHEAQR